jgi:hypothetical protein
MILNRSEVLGPPLAAGNANGIWQRDFMIQPFNVLTYGGVELAREGRIVPLPFRKAGVAELADALDSKTGAMLGSG